MPWREFDNYTNAHAPSPTSHTLELEMPACPLPVLPTLAQATPHLASPVVDVAVRVQHKQLAAQVVPVGPVRHARVQPGGGDMTHSQTLTWMDAEL